VERRSQAQLVLLTAGLIVWGYGERVDEQRYRWVGIACFALAFVLRLVKRRAAPPAD
jgi:hypothetical protein